VINKLAKNNDNLIAQFTKKELEPITKNNYYHSPEISDDENKIIVQDLPWRSDTVSKFVKYLIKIGCSNSFSLLFIINKLRMFLRDYLDKAKENVKAHERNRNRECSDQFASEEAPFNCPEWAAIGYEGDLKQAVNNACKK
jgi:hypothetical protein